MDVIRELDLTEVKRFIDKTPANTKIYIGSDSEKFKMNGVWFADYTVAIVVHIASSKGCKVFGTAYRSRDYDRNAGKPALRLMNEVYLVAEIYQQLVEVIGDRPVEVHLDINPDKSHGSSCVVSQAVGYIKGVCNVDPKVKPNAFAASFAADKLKDILNRT